MSLFFFLSSRRRHTRLQGDWSSDVCSSDLGVFTVLEHSETSDIWCEALGSELLSVRSEERRVGKECRSPGTIAHADNKDSAISWADLSSNGRNIYKRASSFTIL